MVTGGSSDPTGVEFFSAGEWRNYSSIPGPVYAELNQKFSIVAGKQRSSAGYYFIKPITYALCPSDPNFKPGHCQGFTN